MRLSIFSSIIQGYEKQPGHDTDGVHPLPLPASPGDDVRPMEVDDRDETRASMDYNDHTYTNSTERSVTGGSAEELVTEVNDSEEHSGGYRGIGGYGGGGGGDDGSEPSSDDDYGSNVDGQDSPGQQGHGGDGDGGEGDGGDGDGGDGGGLGGVGDVGHVNAYNRFRNPELWTSNELRTLIRIHKREFEQFCIMTAPATQNRTALSHDSRAFLFLYRLCQGASADVLGALFRVSPNTAMRAYKDVLFYLFMNDNNIPTTWNNGNLSEQELTEFLTNLRNAQSPSIRYILLS